MQTILVIEDETQIRENTLKILKFEGFNVVGAPDGEQGVQLARAYLPDLIICDIMMPVLDGYGVLQTLRNDPETALIPFIFLSAKVDRSDIRQGMNLGADDYVTKPFTSQELLETISARLTKRNVITQPYVQEMKQAAASLNKVAYYDLMTNLPNRIMLRHHLQEALHRVQRQQELVTVLCLNINRFRQINATWGHGIGDTLLRSVAERLTEFKVHESDVVARLNGDEFGIVLTKLYHQEEIVTIAQQLIARLTEPYGVEGETLAIQISIGISLYPEDSKQPDKLLNQADVAMRWCQREYGSGYQFFNPIMVAAHEGRRWMTTDLPKALDRGELLIQYQPQVNPITGRLAGLEALLRWHHPQQGILDAGSFVAIAEEIGVMVPMGAWVLDTICQHIQQWQAAGMTLPRISFNVSSGEFHHAHWMDMVIQTLDRTGVDPSQLMLEIDEKHLKPNDRTATILQRLKHLGLQLCIDDFGNGQLSLSYLRHLMIDTVKINYSFIHQLPHNVSDATMVQAILAMAQRLNLQVIAVGVETEEQLLFLCEQGCYLIQGALYSLPLPADAIAQLIPQHQRLMPSYVP